MDCLSRTFPFQHHQRRQNLPMLRFLSLRSPTLSLHLCFVFSQTDLWDDWHPRLTSLCFSYSAIFSSIKQLCVPHRANIRRALLWNCTDLGQRLISLSLLTNPGLRVCILLAFRPLWFNIAPPDTTPHHRQRLGDISLVWQRDGGLFLRSPSIIHDQLGSRAETGQNLETNRRGAFSLMAVSPCGRFDEFDEVRLSH